MHGLQDLVQISMSLTGFGRLVLTNKDVSGWWCYSNLPAMTHDTFITAIFVFPFWIVDCLVRASMAYARTLLGPHASRCHGLLLWLLRVRRRRRSASLISIQTSSLLSLWTYQQIVWILFNYRLQLNLSSRSTFRSKFMFFLLLPNNFDSLNGSVEIWWARLFSDVVKQPGCFSWRPQIITLKGQLWMARWSFRATSAIWISK